MVDFLRTKLSWQTKEIIKTKFPRIYKKLLRRHILHRRGLINYYNKQNNSLLIGKGVLPLDVIFSDEAIRLFWYEHFDIIQPYTKFCNVLEFMEGPYELEEVKLNEGDVVFDCGANMGLFSVMAVGQGCVSHAFEPMPSSVRLLSKVVSVNPAIKLVQCAVGDTDGTARFESLQGVSGEGTLVAEQGKKLQNATIIDVDITTIDSYVEQNKIERVDFIKADIEGAERLMLKGAQKTLAEHAPKLSICTYHLPDDPQVLRELIMEANPKYKIFERYKKMYAYVPGR
jgi:FkbM family methyltransferase